MGRLAVIQCSRDGGIVKDLQAENESMATTAVIMAHAAKAAATARTRILDAFRLRDATAPERALPLAELGLAVDDKYLAEFIRSGVIRGVDSRDRPTVIGYEHVRIGGYFLDERVYIAERDRHDRGGTGRQRRVVLAIMFWLIVVLIPLLFLVINRGSQPGPNPG